MTTLNISGSTTVRLGRKVDEDMSVNLDALPLVSLNQIFAYGLKQILNDSMTSGETGAEKKALAEKKLAALLSGEATARTSTADPVRAEAILIGIGKVRASVLKAGKTVAEYGGDKALRAKAVDMLDNKPEAKAAWMAAAQKIVDDRKAADASLADIEI